MFDPNDPLPVLVHVTVPVGTLLGVVLSVTVAVQAVTTFTTSGLGTHATVVTVVSPALTITLPFAMLRLNRPLQVAPPGMQSFTFELNEAEAECVPGDFDRPVPGRAQRGARKCRLQEYGCAIGAHLNSAVRCASQ